MTGYAKLWTLLDAILPQQLNLYFEALILLSQDFYLLIGRSFAANLQKLEVSAYVELAVAFESVVSFLPEFSLLLTCLQLDYGPLQTLNQHLRLIQQRVDYGKETCWFGLLQPIVKIVQGKLLVMRATPTLLLIHIYC